MTKKKIVERKHYRKPRIKFNGTSQTEEFFPKIQINFGFKLNKLNCWERQDE